MSPKLGPLSPAAMCGFFGATLGLFAGCGSPDQDVELQTVHVCKSDFEATVHEGPDAPLTLRGTLTLTGDSSGAIGYLSPTAASDKIPVNVQFVGSDIALRFFLPDGSMISGQGPATTSLAACAGEMTGALSGPKSGDKGDWLVHNFGADLACQSRCYFHPPLSSGCSNLCHVYGYQDGTAHYSTCYGSCLSGPSTYYCDNISAFFDPCQLP